MQQRTSPCGKRGGVKTGHATPQESQACSQPGSGMCTSQQHLHRQALHTRVLCSAISVPTLILALQYYMHAQDHAGPFLTQGLAWLNTAGQFG